jgi:hypothetical protein
MGAKKPFWGVDIRGQLFILVSRLAFYSAFGMHDHVIFEGSMRGLAPAVVKTVVNSVIAANIDINRVPLRLSSSHAVQTTLLTRRISIAVQPREI